MGRRNLLVGTRFGLHKCTYFKLAESKGRDAHRTKQSATLSTTELLAVPQKVHQRHYVRNSCEGYNNSITPAIKLPESTKSSELSATGLTQQYACLLDGYPSIYMHTSYFGWFGVWYRKAIRKTLSSRSLLMLQSWSTETRRKSSNELNGWNPLEWSQRLCWRVQLLCRRSQQNFRWRVLGGPRSRPALERIKHRCKMREGVINRGILFTFIIT